MSKLNHKPGTRFRGPGGVWVSGRWVAWWQRLRRERRCGEHYWNDKGCVSTCTLKQKGHPRLHGKDPLYGVQVRQETTWQWTLTWSDTSGKSPPVGREIKAASLAVTTRSVKASRPKYSRRVVGWIVTLTAPVKRAKGGR